MTLRQKILLLGLVAVSGMFFALWLQYKAYLTQSQAIEAVVRNVSAVVALSHAAHELQRERGMTAINHSKTNAQALAEQVRHTDAALAGIRGDIASLGMALTQLRTEAATGRITPLAILDSYSKLLQRLADEMDRLTSEPEAAVAKTDMVAHTHLMAVKENLGQIRATLGYWTEHKSDDSVVLNRLFRLKSLQEEELRKFGLDASPELRERLAQEFSGLEVAQTLETLAQIAAAGKLPQTLDVQAWWSMATVAVDRLKVVEDYSLELIEKKAELELTQLRSSMRLGVIITLGIGLAVVIMAISATVALLRALDRALGSMELIAASQDFQIRIPADTPDEIGRISRSFNQLLDIAERLLKEKDYLATTDPLTGVNNRLRFAKVLGDEAERKRRTNTPMALVMFDVDHFKRINDTYGHNVGDEVLKALANLVSTEVRVTDFFGRWGGEEFVLLLRDDDCEAAMAAAEKLRNLIASSDIPSVGKVTCSFGVAAWMLGDTEASLVARADKALYESKKGGPLSAYCAQRTRPWQFPVTPCVQVTRACHQSIPEGVEGHRSGTNVERHE